MQFSTFFDDYKKIQYYLVFLISFILTLSISPSVFASKSQTKTMSETNTNPLVTITTNLGSIKLELYPEKAPKTVANFLKYAEKKYFAGTVFHRVINGFMIQGGGLDANLQSKPNDASIENEADNGLSNQIGSIAMARTGDPHSATSQFFINVGNNTFLNHTAKTNQGWGYAVFGQVIEGMDIVDKIKEVQTGSLNGYQDVPVTTIEITDVSVSK